MSVNKIPRLKSASLEMSDNVQSYPLRKGFDNNTELQIIGGI